VSFGGAGVFCLVVQECFVWWCRSVLFGGAGVCLLMVECVVWWCRSVSFDGGVVCLLVVEWCVFWWCRSVSFGGAGVQQEFYISYTRVASFVLTHMHCSYLASFFFPFTRVLS